MRGTADAASILGAAYPPCGYDIDFSSMDMDELMIATIHAAGGVTDYLERLFKEAICKREDESAGQ